MTSAPPSARPATAVGAPRSRRVALLGLALAASTVTALTAVPATAATPQIGGTAVQSEAGRVVVTALQGGAEGAAAAADAVLAAGGRVLERLPLVGGVSAELPAGAVLAPAFVVAPDRPMRLAASAPATEAPASTVRETLGLGAPAGEGRGVVLAVVDTGVADSADLAGRVTRFDVANAGPGDGYGHGTFIAGVAAGDGASSGGRYAGVAPGAEVLDVKVADNDGSTDLVTVLRGLEVAATHGADVVNLSLSSYSPLPYQIDPLTVALDALWERGVTVVVPAGNDGPDAGTITSPGVDPMLLTVGALDEAGTADRSDDVVPEFSARGPAPQGVQKPDLAAPGRSLVSLRAPGSIIDREHGAGAAVGEHYFKGSGTSFATAVASGAAAVLLAERELSPDQVKLLLTGTSYDSAGLADVTAAGAGGLDLQAARSAAAPVTDDADASPGNGRKVGHLKRDLAIPGAPGQWKQLVAALMAEDSEQAASSWSRLAPEVREWVASSWSALHPDVRAAAVAAWQERGWDGATAEDWAAREWAAMVWGVRNWGVRNWGVRNWGVRNWGVDDSAFEEWTVRNWGVRNWGVRNWGVRNWGVRNWGVRNWGASSWSADAWPASSWSAAEWGGTTLG